MSGRGGVAHQVLEYLRLLWPEGPPAGTRVTLWTPGRGLGRSAWHLPTNEEAACAWEREELRLDDGRAGDGKPASLYLACGATREGLDQWHRGGKADVLAVPGLWCDLDVQGGQHAEPNLPTRAAALEMLRRLPHPPSLILNSGGGLYPWWLFEEPLVFDGDEDRADFEALLRGWHKVLRAQLRAGFGDDQVDGIEGDDLPRVLRPAGGLNRKYGRRVEVVEKHETRRYNPSDFEEWLALGAGGEKAGAGAAAYRGPLPDRAAAHVHYAAEAVGIRNVKASALVLRSCPACGVVGSEASVSPLSGRLRCFRDSCSAAKSKGGIPFEDWTHEHLNPEQLAEIARLRRGSEPELVIAPEPDWPEIGIDQVPDQVAEWLAQSATLGPHSALLGILPTASGKTHALAKAALKSPGGLALFFRDHAKAREFLATLTREAKAQGVELPSVAYRKGVAYGCEFRESLRASGAFGLVKRSLCRGCEHYLRCASTRQPEPSELLVSVHDAYESLSAERVPAADNRTLPLLAGRVAVFDECPDEDLVVTAASKVCEMVHVHRARYAITGVPHVQRCASLLGHGVGELADAALRVKAGPHGRHWSGNELRALILKSAGPNLLDAATVLSDVRAGQLPKLSSIELAAGFYQTAEDVPHSIEVEAVWRGLCALGQDDPEERAKAEAKLGRLFLVQRGGQVTLEVHTRRALGVGGAAGTLILSATGSLHADRLRAACPHLDLHVLGARVRSVGEPHPLRIFCRSSSVTRRALLDGRALRLQHGPRSPTVFEGRLATAMREQVTPILRERWGADAVTAALSRVGLVAFRKCVEGLENVEGLRERVEAKAGAVFERLGYWSNHEQATNIFEECLALVLFGSHVPNLGAIERHAEALGVSRDELLHALAEEALVQGEGRLRHLRRTERLVVVVVRDRPPASWGRETFVEAPLAAHAAGRVAKPSLALAEELVEWAREAREPMAVPAVVCALEGGSSRLGQFLQRETLIGTVPTPQGVRKRVQRAVSTAEAVLGWPSLQVANPRGKAWTVHHPPDWGREDVEAWAQEAQQRRRATLEIERVRALPEFAATLAVGNPHELVTCLLAAGHRQAALDAHLREENPVVSVIAGVNGADLLFATPAGWPRELEVCALAKRFERVLEERNLAPVRRLLARDRAPLAFGRAFGYSDAALRHAREEFAEVEGRAVAIARAQAESCYAWGERLTPDDDTLARLLERERVLPCWSGPRAPGGFSRGVLGLPFWMWRDPSGEAWKAKAAPAQVLAELGARLPASEAYQDQLDRAQQLLAIRVLCPRTVSLDAYPEEERKRQAAAAAGGLAWQDGGFRTAPASLPALAVLLEELDLIERAG